MCSCRFLSLLRRALRTAELGGTNAVRRRAAVTVTGVFGMSLFRMPPTWQICRYQRHGDIGCDAILYIYSHIRLTCVQVLRVMAMTGAGLEEEGALEAGIAAMSSILGMHGLPREQAAVANLMAGMVKAMGSIACLSEVLLCCLALNRFACRHVARELFSAGYCDEIAQIYLYPCRDFPVEVGRGKSTQ